VNAVSAKGLTVDLNDAQWRKSSLSGGSCDNCVEVAFVDKAIVVRDSKDPSGPVLLYTRAEWDAFIGGIKNGEFEK